MASRSSTRIATRSPRNSKVPSEGETQRSNAGTLRSLSTITFIYVFFNGRMAMRLDPVDSGVLAKSSARTGSARRTSGSLAATDGRPADAGGRTAATAGAGGATAGADGAPIGRDTAVPGEPGT